MSTSVLVIGSSSRGELGLGTDTVNELTPLPEQSISKIFSSKRSAIYCDDDCKTIFAACGADTDNIDEKQLKLFKVTTGVRIIRLNN